jgi:subtilisin family serine protease
VVAAVAGLAIAGVWTSTSQAARPQSHAAPSTRKRLHVPRIADGRLLVGLEPGATAADRHAVAAAAGATSSTTVNDGQTLVLDVPPSRAPGAPANVRRHTRVRYIEPNYSVQAQFVPNDPLYAAQQNLHPGTGGIDAQDAWDVTQGSASVVVGVLDTGADLTHPDLAPNLWTNAAGSGGCAVGTHGFESADYTDGEHVGCMPDDDNGHGSHVSGIVAAKGNNGMGVSGVAPNVEIMPLKVLDNEGSGSDADVVTAIQWALDRKAEGVDVRVLNASFGTAPGTPASPAVSDAINAAALQGVLFVAAAGNGNAQNVGLDLSNPANAVYPCSFKLASEVCVAATDASDHLASFSNYGAGVVQIAAPGVEIESTMLPGSPIGCGPMNQDLYCPLSGTSMATPHVSGAAALLASAEPGLTVAQLRAALLSGFDPLPDPTDASRIGTHGRLDICLSMPGSVCALGPPLDLVASAGHGKVTLQWSPPRSNGGSAITGYVAQQVGHAPVLLPGAATSTTFSGLPDDVEASFTVAASNAAGTGPAASVSARPHSGGVVLDAFGGLHNLIPPGGSSIGSPVGGASWPGWKIARGVALLPNGNGGYVLDGFGGAHPFTFAGAPMPPKVVGGPAWPGWDIARGIVVTGDGTGGYVIDAYGALHAFAIGSNLPPPPSLGGTPWPGKDLARGVALNGSAGYILDAFGGLHTFALAGGVRPQPPSRAATWPGFDIARGVTVLGPTTGGYVIDGFGGTHPFVTAVGAAAPAKPAGPSWPGSDLARGLDF